MYLRKFSKSNWRENKKGIFCIPNGDAPIDSCFNQKFYYVSTMPWWIFGLPKVDSLQQTPKKRKI